MKMKKIELNGTEIEVRDTGPSEVDMWIASEKAISTAIEVKGALQSIILQWDTLFQKYRELDQKYNNLKGRHNKLKERVEWIEDYWEMREPQEAINKKPASVRDKCRPTRV